MTRTIKSETNDTHYFLTIDETGHATDCSCGDQHFRCHIAGNPAHQCKHIKHYNAAFDLALAFAAEKARFDCRSQAVIEQKRAAYFYYEQAIAC